MPFFSGTMVHNFTLDNSKHVLKTLHVRKKQCTTVLKSKTLNLFQNNGVNSFLYLSCHSSSYSVSTVKVRDTYIPSPFFYAYLLQTPDNSNLF